MDFDLRLVLALCTGIGLAAATGLRAFLPLFALGLAARFGVVPLHDGAGWMTSDVALWSLGAATVVEILGDKVPIVDHALDAIGTVLRPAAAFVGGYAALAGWGEPWAPLAALVFGGGALAVHAAKSKVRVGSTVATAGAANPFLSAIEDVFSAVLTLFAVLLPLFVLAVVLVLVWWVSRRRARTPATASQAPTP